MLSGPCGPFEFPFAANQLPCTLFLLLLAHCMFIIFPPFIQGMCTEDIPKDVLADCAQLVKANSIQGRRKNLFHIYLFIFFMYQLSLLFIGCKLSSVTVVYTAFSNLKKTGSMDVGQVGFHDQKKVQQYRIAGNFRGGKFSRILRIFKYS